MHTTQEWLEARGFFTTSDLVSVFILSQEGKDQLKEHPIGYINSENSRRRDRNESPWILGIVLNSRVVVVSDDHRAFVCSPGACADKCAVPDCKCVTWAKACAQAAFTQQP